MPDNTTDFNVKVTADTKNADQNVKKLGDNVEDTDEKFKSLRSQIRETTVALQKLGDEGVSSGEEFERLRSKLDDLNDTQERVAFSAGQFDDKLSAMPGVLGQAGSALKTMNDSVNQFGKTLAYSFGIVGLIVSAFLLMKKSLESTAEGQALLTRLTTSFQKVLGPLMALVESVAIPVFEAFAKGLEFVATGLAKAAEFIGISSTKIKEASSGVKDFKKDAEELAKSQKEAADKATADSKAAADKAKAAREKAAAEQKQRNEAGAKVETEAILSLLDNRDREIREREDRFKADKKTKLLSNNKDLTNVTKEFNKDIADINKKYDDEAIKKTTEKFAKEKAELEKGAEELNKYYKAQEDLKRASDFNVLQSEIETLNAANDARELDFGKDAERFELIQQRLLQQMQLELDATKGIEGEEIKRLEIRKKYGDQIIAVDKQITASNRAEAEARKQVQLAFAAAAGAAGKLLQQIAGENKGVQIAGLLIEQGAALASIAINASKNFIKDGGVTSPLAYANLAAAVFQAASVVAATVKGIQDINSVTPSGGGGGGGASIPSIQAPRVGEAQTPQMAEGAGANPGAQIANSLVQSQNSNPVRAYVVSQDITSQQQLDRKSNMAAVF